MQFNIHYYGITPKRAVAGTVGSYGVETMELTFSSEWDGLGKKIVFYPPGEESPVGVPWTGEPVPIPAEVFQRRGICRFAVVGYQEEKTLVTVTGELDVLGTLPAEADDAVAPTPSEFSQLYSLAQNVMESAEGANIAAEEAKTAAQTAAASAENAAEYAAAATDAADQAKEEAEQATEVALESRTTALNAEQAAKNSESACLLAQQAAETAKNAAETAETELQGAIASAENSVQVSKAAAQAAADCAQSLAEEVRTEAQRAVEIASGVRQDVQSGALNGKNGKTPSIGENGNWFLGEEDLGVPAACPTIQDEEVTEENLWSAKKITDWVGDTCSPPLVGMAEGKSLAMGDAVLREGSPWAVEFLGEVSKTPGSDNAVIWTPTTHAKFWMYGENLLDPETLETGTLAASGAKPNANPDRTRIPMLALGAGVYYWKRNVPARTHLFAKDGTWLRSVQENCFTVSETEGYIRAVWSSAIESVKQNLPVLTRFEKESSTLKNYRTPLTVEREFSPLYALGETCDSVMVSSEHSVRRTIRRIGVLILTGNEAWSKQEQTGVFSLYHAIPSAPADTAGDCTHAVYRWGGDATETESSVAGFSGTTLYYHPVNGGEQSLSQFCSWLGVQAELGQPVTLLYRLGEEAVITEEEAGEEILPLFPSFDGKLTLFSDVPMKVYYHREPAAYLQALSDRIAALEDAITSVNA